MIKYRVRQVVDPIGPWTIIEASSSEEAIAQATGGKPRDFRGFYRPRVGTERYAVPSGNELQSWDVEDARLVPILEELALHVGSSNRGDILDIEAQVLAVDEVVKATGMRPSEADLLVRTWLATLTSRHYDTIRRQRNE